jgi:hypothetical protein
MRIYGNARMIQAPNPRRATASKAAAYCTTYVRDPEPERPAREGWVGRAERHLDPRGQAARGVV